VVTYTQQDNFIGFTGLFPLAAGETVSLRLTDAFGAFTDHILTNPRFDISALADGDYSFRVLKTGGAGAVVDVRRGVHRRSRPSALEPRRLPAASARGAGESLAFTLTDSQGVSTSYPFAARPV